MEYINNLVEEVLRNETIVIEEPIAPTFEGILIGGPEMGLVSFNMTLASVI